MEFLATPGTPEHETVQAWSEWGIPFKDARVRTKTVGGPFAAGEPVESTVSIIERNHDEGPRLYLRCSADNGQSRFRLPLTIVSRTVGAHTGWIRLVVETPERTLHFELHFKQGEGVEARAQMGDVDGRNPEAVRDELEALLRIDADDVISVETGSNQSLVRVHSTVLPTALEALYLPVARSLTKLQDHTAPMLVMPSIKEITDSQFQYLSLLSSIYGGTAHKWSWTEITLQVPDDESEARRIREVAANALAARHTFVKVEAPAFQLGNRTYTVGHPLASTAHSGGVPLCGGVCRHRAGQLF